MEAAAGAQEPLRLAENSEPRWWLMALLLLYTPAVIFPHESVQGLLARAVQPIGLRAFYAIAAVVGGLWLVVLTGVLWRRVQSHAARGLLTRYWLLTLGLMVAAWQLLSVNNSELVHFPQYAISGFLLMLLTRHVTETLSWITIAGSLDEGYQYAVLHPTWGIPFDFNDVYLDLLGGAAGCLLAAAFLRAVPGMGTHFRRAGIVVLTVVVAAGLVLVPFGKVVAYQDENQHHWIAMSRLRPKGFWFFDATWGPRRIHTLTPVEGPLLLAATLAVFSLLDRRYRFQP
ncbi:MAG: hypothetical protein JNK87_00885 [Bryobacterales bacterium]|nr:hypothetical protein [Bryobacterales bacterium]